MGGDQPRGCLYGTMGTAGQLAYWNTGHTDNQYLQFVFVLGEGPHDSLDAIWVNGKKYELSIQSEDQWHVVYTVAGFGAYLAIEFWRGYQDQPSATDLVTWANPSSRWTSNDRLSGVCYALVRAVYEEHLYDSGIPRFLFGVKGRRCYDWRKDSTAGGSGAHRWSDEHTWEFSENPIVHIYDYQRGLHLGGELVVGMGVPPVDLMMDLYTAGASACEELVALESGDTEARYTGATYVSAAEEHGTVIERILDGCAGSMYERVGAYGPIVGVAQTVVYPTITDGDLVAGQPVSFRAKLGRADLVNGIFGSYCSPDEQYELTAYTARTDPVAEAADTEPRRAPVDFPQVTRHSQTQRLVLIQLRLARLQATATITLGFAAIVLEPGDWVRWNSARYGDRTYVILSLVQNADQTVTLSLRQVSAAAYSWSTSEELPAPAPSEPALPGAQASGVTGFSLSALTLTGAGGTKAPAVRVFWSPMGDATVTAVLIEYRIAGTTDVMSERATSPSMGEYLVKAGLVGETDYEFRATIETTPARDTTWTAWEPITTSEQVVTSMPANDSVTPEQFTEATRDLVLTQMQTALTTLRDGIDRLSLIVADVDAAGDLNKREISRTIAVQVGTALARFTEQITVLVASDAAIAAQVTELEAAMGNVEANLKARYVVAVTPAGALAAYELQATAEEASAGFRLVAMDDGLGGAIGQVSIQADRFFITADDAAGDIGTAVFLVDNTGPTPTIYLNGDMVAAGSITADKLSVAELSAIVANLGEIVAGLLRSTDNKFRVELDNARLLVSS